MEKIKGSIYLMGGFALAGTSVIAARFVSQSLGTFTITTVSLFFAMLGLLPFCYQRLGRSISQLGLRHWLDLCVQAACGIFLFRMFLIQGLNYTSTGEAGILTGAAPAVTAILAVIWLKEPMHPKGWVGITSTVAGVAVLQGLSAPGSGFSLEHFGGNLLVLCAAGCEALFNVISRRSSLNNRADQALRLDPLIQTWLVALIAFLFCLAAAGFEQPLPALRALGMAQWLALLWYGLFVTALAFILFYAGIKRCSATSAAVFSAVMPFTALVLSILVLGEPVNGQQWLGGAMIVLGMLLTGG